MTAYMYICIHIYIYIYTEAHIRIDTEWLQNVQVIYVPRAHVWYT